MSGGSPTNAGAIVNDAAGSLFNVPGCVALLDKTSGTACAQALAPLQECDDAACLDCYSGGTVSASLGTCYTSAESGACASYAGSASSLCTSEYGDGGVGNTCQDATTILNVFCGTGS
jgi:hypothetical protein